QHLPSFPTRRSSDLIKYRLVIHEHTEAIALAGRLYTNLECPCVFGNIIASPSPRLSFGRSRHKLLKLFNTRDVLPSESSIVDAQNHSGALGSTRQIPVVELL